MRALTTTVATSLAVLQLAAAAHAATPPQTACDLHLNIADQDPAGTNVRTLPGMDGAIITAIKAKGIWVRVHITGQSGAWMSIDEAIHIDDSTADETPVFQAKGWVAVSKLGFEELDSNTTVYAAPDSGSRVLLHFLEGDEARLPKATVLGCDGTWLKVRVRGVVGWTQNFCTNWLTTCV